MINDFESILIKAVNKIDENYYKIKIIGTSDKIVRERVFCYELYHQMRQLKKEDQFFIHAEIDKRGHHEFDKDDRKNPDFVYHIPGDFNKESIIVEVKGKNDKNGIIKDFKTIQKFIRNYEYKGGYFLLYNHSFGELKDSFSKEDLIEFRDVEDSIKIICKKKSASEMEIKFLAELISEGDFITI